MNGDPADNALIERFLLNKLSSDEVIDFNLRLDEDREFARRYRLMSMFPEMMSEQGRKEFEQQAHAETIQAPKKPLVNLSKRSLLMAGAVIVLVCAAGLTVFITRQASINSASIDSASIDSASINSASITPAAVETEKISQSVKKEIKGLISPGDGETISRNETIVFQWEQKADTFTRICIQSEPTKRIVLWRGIKPGVQNFEIPGLYLKPGQYSWYIGADASTIGSFSISESLN